jgi:hypothetical protein
VIVVIGVFVGLQVQEWSVERADRKAERSVIERLILEYEQNIEVLVDDQEKAVGAMEGSAKLLSMIAPEPDPNLTDELVAPILIACMQNAKFIPVLGTTNSLFASGDLSLIGDPEIQRMLNQWQTTAQVMIEWQEIERMHGEELILGETYEYLAWPTLSVYEGAWARPSNMTSDYQGLFSSKRFEGLLHNRWYNTRVAIERMEELKAQTRILIDRLEMRIGEL